MRKPTYQYFTLEEYQQRLDALRRRMQEKGVDVVLVTTPENLHYMTGYQTPGYYWFQTLIVPMDSEPVFVTRLIEATNIEPLAWVEDSRPYKDYEDWVAKTKDALTDIGVANKRIGLEYDSWFLTTRDYLRLTAMLPDAKFVDCSGLVEQGRMIKSPQEIDYIRQAAEAAEAGMRAGIETTEVGATENDVAAAIHSAQIKAGSEYTGLPIFIRSGSRNAMTHSTWYRKKLEPNEGVSFEIPGCINRYHAAHYRQVYLGDPPDVLVRATDLAINTLQLAKSLIKPGIRAEDVFEAIRQNIESTDLGASVLQRIAYSIGIAYAPDWGEGHIISMVKGEKRPLQAGMTFHLIAGLVRLPQLEKIRVAVCTDSILVTKNGCETLTDGIERKLYVK